MFVRKKTNRSGTISVVVVSKAHGKFTEVKKFGVAKSEEEAEAKRESMARQKRYIGVLDKFIHEGHEALSSFAKTDRVNFNEKESVSIYYGIMASAVKHNIGLDSKACIE